MAIAGTNAVINVAGYGVLIGRGIVGFTPLALILATTLIPA